MHAWALSATYLRVPERIASDASVEHSDARYVWQAFASTLQRAAIWHSAFAFAMQKLWTSG